MSGDVHSTVNGVSSRLSLRREVARKALHLVFAVVPLAYAFGLPRGWLVTALGVAAAAAVIIELARARHAPTRERFVRWVGVLLREHEYARWSGATWMVLSMLALAALVPRGAAVAAMWAISAGDAAAALVGRAFERRTNGSPARGPAVMAHPEHGERMGVRSVERTGRDESMGIQSIELAKHGEGMGARESRRAGGKTIRGSAACFVVTLAGALVLARLSLAESVVAAALATIAERFGARVGVDDNVRIAAAVALGILLWHKMFS